MMTAEETIAWSEQQEAAGVKDAVGCPWTSWLIAVKGADGTMVRDRDGHQIFQTQSEYKRSRSTPVGQTLELFA